MPTPELLMAAVRVQTDNLGNFLASDMLASDRSENRQSPMRMVEVPAGVLLSLIVRIGAAEQDIKWLLEGIAAADLPDYR
jgi:hypothetical protein